MKSLNKLTNFTGRPGPLVFMILDGVGIGKEYEGNAVWKAKPENFNRLMNDAKEKKLYCELKAHGPAVGLPTDGDMGNSEVGHNALGAGQIFPQGAKLVNEALDDGSFFETACWNKTVCASSKEGKAIHFIGLLSDGNVHSHVNQLYKMIDGCIKDGVKKIRVHPLLDGRDVSPDSGLEYIEKLENKLSELRGGGVDAVIASGGGRMHVTMDRYNSDWRMVKRGWYAHVLGKVDDEDITPEYSGYFSNSKEAILKARELWPKKQDQFNPQFVIVDDSGNPVGKMEDGDTVINFNFRGDRAIEISQAFEDEKFEAFDRIERPNVRYAGLLEYDGDAHIPSNFLVPPPKIKNVSAEYLCKEEIKSYAIAETHKFGHVTYFWNGNKSGYISEEHELYEEVKSDSNDMIESNPEMKVRGVTDKLLEKIKSDKFKFLRVNYANGDMVGHTGNIEACIKSIQAMDICIQEVVDEVIQKNGVVIITSDHGNSEEKLDKKGKVITSHSLNPVPFFIIDSCDERNYIIDINDIFEPGISNVASTFLNLLGYEAPVGYQKSLIKFN